MPSRLPDRIEPSGPGRRILRGVGRGLRAFCEKLFDEFGPISLGLEYGVTGVVIGAAVWLLFGLIWGLVVAVTVTGGLAGRRIR